MASSASQPPTEPGNSQLAALAIDRRAEVPVGVQLGWTLCSLIRDGNFKAGERLPTLRELAEASGLNVNTVRAVYQRLEQRGLVRSQQGNGTFVASALPRRAELGRIATKAAHEAREAGVDPRDVAAALYVAARPPAAGADGAADVSEIGQRQLLRRQIAAFESALGEIEAANPGVAPPPEPAHAAAGPALLGTRELEQVRTLLVRRLATVQAAIDAQQEDPAADLAIARATRSRKVAKAAGAQPDPAAQHKRKGRPRATVRTLPAST